ncbi:MAG: S1 RNA-binding domain-containing protein [Acholeplasmataceae bacterium]|nr:S1 RNA-binding domain-containing protein [Acholeplasmataceae bacterium]
MEKNEMITCVITGIQSYGIFVTCDAYQGLVHISEISDHYIDAIDALFDVGDDITLSIIEVDEKKKRLRLSYKRAHPVHPKIQKTIKIKKGFHSLSKALPHWIDEAKKM